MSQIKNVTAVGVIIINYRVYEYFLSIRNSRTFSYERYFSDWRSYPGDLRVYYLWFTKDYFSLGDHDTDNEFS